MGEPLPEEAVDESGDVAGLVGRVLVGGLSHSEAGEGIPDLDVDRQYLLDGLGDGARSPIVHPRPVAHEPGEIDRRLSVNILVRILQPHHVRLVPEEEPQDPRPHKQASVAPCSGCLPQGRS